LLASNIPEAAVTLFVKAPTPEGGGKPVQMLHVNAEGLSRSDLGACTRPLYLNAIGHIQRVVDDHDVVHLS